MNYEERRQMINNEQEDTDNNLNQQEDSKDYQLCLGYLLLS